MSVPPATQKPCTLQTTGLPQWNSRMKPLDVAAHHRVVDHRVPGSARVVVGSDRRRVDRRAGAGVPREAVAAGPVEPSAAPIPSALSTRS